MICFQETSDTGFGDRLRGIAYLLHLAHAQGEREILYNDEVTVREQAVRDAAFPARMTDLIRLEGLSFEFHPLPFPAGAQVVVHDSVIDRKKQNRPGFPYMHLLRPRDEAVAERVRNLGVNRRWLGFHVRRTDNLELSKRHFDDLLERRALKNLGCFALRYRTRRIFLAADNGRSLARWTRILETAGYEVRTNSPYYDTSRLRQTGTFDMMVDFFALAACRRVVRAVPSEFSRFAAWAGGTRIKYSRLT
jgi:hypothetical protein